MRRLSYLFVLVLAAMLALPATVGAAGRTPVDPSIMQPALNPAFTWTCWRMDDKTMCDGEPHDSWTALDIGVPCAGGTIYSTGTQDQTLRRWGDAEGLALHTHGTGDISETLALNPEMTGTTARLSAHSANGSSMASPVMPRPGWRS